MKWRKPPWSSAVEKQIAVDNNVYNVIDTLARPINDPTVQIESNLLTFSCTYQFAIDFYKVICMPP